MKALLSFSYSIHICEIFSHSCLLGWMMKQESFPMLIKIASPVFFQYAHLVLARVIRTCSWCKMIGIFCMEIGSSCLRQVTSVWTGYNILFPVIGPFLLFDLLQLSPVQRFCCYHLQGQATITFNINNLFFILFRGLSWGKCQL